MAFYPGEESWTEVETDAGIIVDNIQNISTRTQDSG